MPTIKDVAREAGVSVATVSYVLNNKQDLVSEPTRRAVLEAIKRVGYTPSVVGRGLQANKSHLIGYAWHPITYGQVNPVLDQFTYFMAHAAEEAGYHLLTFTCPLDDPVPVYEDLITTRRVDAFVLSGTRQNDPRIAYLLERGFPFVSFGRSNPEWAFSYVDTDARTGVREAVSYLVALGHRRIAFVGWPEGSLSGDWRLQGYLDGMHAFALPVPPPYVQRGVQSNTTGRQALCHWWELPEAERPTAVIAVTDLIAVGVMLQAREFGLSLPADLSIIGFDNAPLVEYFTPALTTFEQRIPEIGHILVELVERMVRGDQPEHRQVLVPPRLIVRDSCAPPPAR
ncbi:LacI family DNA-binding transcriptional regulator [Aggregatilineales bacterium SYSU G02658]